MGDISGGRGDGPADWLAAVVASVRFLTRIPLPAGAADMPLQKAMAAFPVAGAMIGTVTGCLVAVLAGLGVPGLAAAATALAAGALVTGGLHEDGLADVADGFGGGRTAEHTLEIMRDSRIGSYGVVALVLVMLAKAAAMAAIVAAGPWAAILVLSAAGAASRSAMVWLLAATPPARNDGLGASASAPSQRTHLSALALGTGLAMLFAWPGAGLLAAVLALIFSAAVAIIVRLVALRRIGGQTGDVCGALQMVTEAVFLITAAAMVH